MYITDWRLDAITKLHKLTGDKEEILVRESQNNRLYGVKVYSESEQVLNNTHPCAVNNGGCQKLCFAVPTKTESISGLKVVMFFFLLEEMINLPHKFEIFKWL